MVSSAIAFVLVWQPDSWLWCWVSLGSLEIQIKTGMCFEQLKNRFQREG